MCKLMCYPYCYHAAYFRMLSVTRTSLTLWSSCSIGFKTLVDLIMSRLPYSSFSSVQHDDVWFVTNEQLLEWMRDPKEASELDGLGYLDCEMPEVDAEICNGMESTQAGLLVDCPFGDPLQWGASSCYGCPSEVPDVGNPTPDQVEVEGQSQREPVSSDCPTVWWDPIKGECRCSGDECDVGRGGDDSAAAPMVHFAALILITAPLFAVLAVV